VIPPAKWFGLYIRTTIASASRHNGAFLPGD
jgi:hypothetical protein